MRVVHVLHSLSVGGAEVLVRDFVAATHATVPQSVVCLDELGALGEGLRAAGVRVDVIGRRGGLEPRVALALRGLLHEQRTDVVVAHQYTPYSYAAMATPLLARRPGLVFIEHGRHYPDFRRPKRVAVNQLFLQWTRRVVAVCGFVKRLLVEHEGIAPGRIQVIYNGVDPSRFQRPLDREAARAALGLAPDELAVTCVARVHPVKDHPTLVQAFARAVARVPRARLVLVGGGEPARLEALHRLVDALGITDRVLFTGVRQDVPEIYAASDLFAMASLSEGTSVTLLEAMLSRRAAVVTDVGGNPEIVERDATGLLVPRGDAEQLGDAIANLLLSPARREAMGRRARDRVLQRFDKERMHRAWLGLLNDSVR